MSTPEDSPTIGIAPLAACLVLGWLFLRWYNSGSSTPRGQTGTNTQRTSRPQRSARDIARLREKASVVRAMFPQLSEEAIVWELMKNGESIEGVTEVVLRDGRLPDPPEPVLPQQATPAARPTPTPNTAASSSSSKSPDSYPDLITRYNLQDKLKQEAAEDASTDKGKQAAWSNNKAERAAMLQKRREEMILAARRKVEAKERAKEKGKAVDTSA